MLSYYSSEQPPLAEGEEEDPGRIVPALCIGADGLIMINESRWVSSINIDQKKSRQIVQGYSYVQSR